MPIPVGSGTEVDLVQFSPLFPSASRALLCQHLLHLSVVLQPSIDAAAKPSLSSQTSILLGTPSHSGGLFLQEHYCLALGQEEVADLPLFCVRQRQEALGHEGTCLVPPKLKECACEKLIFSPRRTEAEGLRWHDCCPSCFKSRYSDVSSSPPRHWRVRLPLGRRGSTEVREGTAPS